MAQENDIVLFDNIKQLFKRKRQINVGDIGIYQAVWNAPGPWAVVVSTQQKRWEIRPLEQASVQFYGLRKQEPFEVHPWDKDFKPGLRLQAQQAINAVKGVDHTLPTLDDAMESMKLVKEFYFGV